MDEPMIRLGITMPKELKEDIEVFAKYNSMPVSALVRLAMLHVMRNPSVLGMKAPPTEENDEQA